MTSAVVSDMRSQNIYGGNFYWFENNWHYIRKWDHLKNNIFLNNQSEQLQQQLHKYSTHSFTASDAIMSRCISTAISLTWTEEQVKEKGDKMIGVIKKVLENKYASV
jgi:8-amino-3,8-dideoxy-alpha-D-manno-octulosonate transaminase